MTHPAIFNGHPVNTFHLDEDQVQLIDRNILIGGEPGGGKSIALLNTIDGYPTSNSGRPLRVLDSRGPELDAWKGLADAFLDPNQQMWIGDGKTLDLDNPDQPKESP